MSSTVKGKLLEGALTLSLLTGVGGAGLPAANAQSSGSQSAHATYYVSSQHPDPNFQGAGADGALSWLTDPATGLPRLTLQGNNNPQYYGYDPATQKSYMRIKSNANNVYSYKRGEGLVVANELPAGIIKVKALANNTGIYGQYADGAPHGSDETQRALASPSSKPTQLPDTQTGEPTIRKVGSTWTLAFADPKDGKQRTLQASRPHVKGYGIDFTESEWSKPQYQTPVGMFVAKDGTGYRFITSTASPSDPSKSLRVDVYPKLDQPATDLGTIKKVIETQPGVTFIDASAAQTAQR